MDEECCWSVWLRRNLFHLWTRHMALSLWLLLQISNSHINNSLTINRTQTSDVLKRSRTLRAPCPTRTSSNSGPAAWKKGTPASPATALASNVFPVPGGPTNNTPLGNLPPNDENFSGDFKNSTWNGPCLKNIRTQRAMEQFYGTIRSL